MGEISLFVQNLDLRLKCSEQTKRLLHAILQLAKCTKLQLQTEPQRLPTLFDS